MNFIVRRHAWRWWISVLLLLSLVGHTFGQANPNPITQAASQGEVNAGVNRLKFVSPYTLAGYSGGLTAGALTNNETRAVTLSSNLTARLFTGDGSGLSNITVTATTTNTGPVTNGPIGYGNQYRTNSLSIAAAGTEVVGKFGVGTASPTFAVELRDGTTDQAIAITRETNTSYANFGYRTGSTYNWAQGLRSGNSDWYLYDATGGSYLKSFFGSGGLRILNQGTSFLDNSIELVNNTGGYSAIAFRQPGHAFDSGRALALGMGTNDSSGVYANKGYLATNPDNGSGGEPPDIGISQEEAGTNYMAHWRLYFWGTDGDVDFYSYDTNRVFGDPALHVDGPTARVGLGTTNPAFAMELRNGSSDQAIAITRETNTSYANIGYRTGGTYNWAQGLRSGSSDWYLFDSTSGAYLRSFFGGGGLRMLGQGTNLVVNSIELVNNTGGNSAIAFRQPGYAFDSGRSFALGMGTNNSDAYANKGFITTHPDNSSGEPPDIGIAQEEASTAHWRQYFWGTDGDVDFYAYDTNAVFGTPALHVDGPTGRIGVGTTNPSAPLHVIGNLLFSGIATGDGSGLTNLSATATNLGAALTNNDTRPITLASNLTVNGNIAASGSNYFSGAFNTAGPSLQQQSSNSITLNWAGNSRLYTPTNASFTTTISGTARTGQWMTHVITNSSANTITNTLGFNAVSFSEGTTVSNVRIPASSALQLDFYFDGTIYWLRDFGKNNANLVGWADYGVTLTNSASTGQVVYASSPTTGFWGAAPTGGAGGGGGLPGTNSVIAYGSSAISNSIGQFGNSTIISNAAGSVLIEPATAAGSYVSLGSITTNKLYTVGGSNDLALMVGGTNAVTMTNTGAAIVVSLAATPAINDNSTKAATTAYVDRKVTTVAATANVTNTSTTGAKITSLDTVAAPGTYVFQYFLKYASTNAGTGVKFGINHTGTATVVANMRYAGTGTTASTGAATQAGSGATGLVHESFSTRTASTTSPNLGPTVSVDSTAASMLAIIEGVLVVTVSGNIELWHASEVASTSYVEANSVLILTRAL